VSGGFGAGQVDFAVDVDNPIAAGVTQIDNTVEVGDDGASGADVNPGDNSDSDSTPVVAAPDMQISKDEGDVVVLPGETILYTLIMTNAGDQNATGVVVTDTVPANTTFNSTASSSGWLCVPDSSAGSICTFDVSAVLGGEFAGDSDQIVIILFAVDVDHPLPQHGRDRRRRRQWRRSESWRQRGDRHHCGQRATGDRRHLAGEPERAV
jgi:uncharacterized repeat protein (TIGR01451 family)